MGDQDRDDARADLEAARRFMATHLSEEARDDILPRLESFDSANDLAANAWIA